jgi:hypothetical protein
MTWEEKGVLRVDSPAIARAQLLKGEFLDPNIAIGTALLHAPLQDSHAPLMTGGKNAVRR